MSPPRTCTIKLFTTVISGPAIHWNDNSSKWQFTKCSYGQHFIEATIHWRSNSLKWQFTHAHMGSISTATIHWRNNAPKQQFTKCSYRQNFTEWSYGACNEHLVKCHLMNCFDELPLQWIAASMKCHFDELLLWWIAASMNCCFNELLHWWIASSPSNQHWIIVS